ncbi:MAG: LicD family protein [Clostridia bacterium]|nr:LicD family protein [Clostridia bacterium]
MLKLADKKLICSKAVADCVDIISSNSIDSDSSIGAVSLYKLISRNLMPYLRNEEKAEKILDGVTEKTSGLAKNSLSLAQDFKQTLSDYLSLDETESSVLAVSFLCSAYVRFFTENIEEENDFIPRLDLLCATLGCTSYSDIPKQLDFINELLDFKVPEFIGDTKCQQLITALGEKTTDLDYDTIQYAVYRIFKKVKLADLYNYYEARGLESKLEELNRQYADFDPQSFVDNPSYIAKRERASFVKGLQKYTLETLVLTKEFLEKHNLRFYLTEGTLLGAVRHNGFIPWDDDIDIAMPRDDYDKLVELAKNGEIPPELNFDSLENNPKHWVLGAKMQLVRQTPYIQHKVTKLSKCNGPYVDIFPLEYWNRPAGRKVHFISTIQKICRKMLFMKTGYSPVTKKKLTRRVLKLLLPFISNRSIEKLAIKNMKKFYNGNRKYLVNLCSYYPYYKEVFPSGFFGEPVYMDFEGYKMPVPCEYDYILKTVYGRNYDTIPPVKVTKMRKHAFNLREDVID